MTWAEAYADQHASQGRADYIVARACDASAGEADAVVATRAAADADPAAFAGADVTTSETIE